MTATLRGGLATAACLALALAPLGGCRPSDSAPAANATAPKPPLRLVVMDPLAAQLACDCVAGFAQRKYGGLARFLEARLARDVRIAFGESLAQVLRRHPGKPDLIVGKRSVVIHDAAAARLPIRPIALLTGPDGRTTLTGLFVVRTADKARRIADLAGRTILLGPPDCDEKHAAALAALKAAGVAPPKRPRISPSCSSAALDVVEKKADAAVVSSYAMPLLEGCGTIDKHALRIIGRSPPVPFVTAFVTDAVSAGQERDILAALRAVHTDAGLLKAMESKSGFLPVGPAAAAPGPGGSCIPAGPAAGTARCPHTGLAPSGTG